MSSGLDAAGRLLDFYADQALLLGGRRGQALADAIAAVHEFDQRIGLTFGVLYGDPSPEVLRDNLTGALALIDWGTPSWGPVLFDLVSWQLFVAEQQPSATGAAERLMAAYRARMPIDDADLIGCVVIRQLYQEVRATWSLSGRALGSAELARHSADSGVSQQVSATSRTQLPVPLHSTLIRSTTFIPARRQIN